MREIKFRGVVSDDCEFDGDVLFTKGQLVYGHLVTDHKGELYILGDMIEVDNEMTIFESWIGVDSNTVGQYTGLKDYNKKEVYEGDIVTFTEVDEGSCVGREDTHTGVIEWIEDTAKWMFRYPSGQKRDLWTIASFEMISHFEVIGNIYENPDLLGKE